ncbi:MAG: GGDEF domain-containing protein [gamma proteobacterium symbiont of Bathyaustriella thionipta]|nr:GGDEF domain-containing protein [gamma proteobacterium symbiont of Bathyaustriella thionipta]MCU7950965.1 GGDEF domain-containing protein [gamma proteobacterium symbiont of Bathyaustriella thionipta]MCU7953194.1 GGDEF domain-containing protein [gamma proteobacterium symbiont of Bathyaustriella thionipta]MCU7957455.1 GGDEF domain-containing protein [gamma proteobacterium symbiont of Bathyaustriella thionipta]MCU7968401.1 GGDEF domain-containing protein [gamma proteobacterium symbiont of Bathy
MSSTTIKQASITASTKNMSAPSLKNRLKISIIVIILPLFLLAGIGFFFFQKSTNAFNLAIEDIVTDIIPVTELKDKIQQTVIPFNHFMEEHQLDNKTKFLQLSNEIKKSLANPIKFEQQNHSLANDIYRSAYLNWRNAHRVAIKIFSEIENQKPHISHRLLQDFYQYVIETTLALDKLHLAMQDRVKINFQKAKVLKLDALIFIGFVFFIVYVITLGTIIYLNRSIMSPIAELEEWALHFSRGKTNPLSLQIHSYREFEFIAATYTKLSKMLQDDEAVLEQLSQKDELTQLTNRRTFLEHLKTEHIRHQRYNSHYSLIYIDIDHMGSVYQNYGEHICDLTLIQISKMLEEAIRPTDFLSRYDNDEFIIMLPEVDEHGAHHTAERIRNSISEYVFKINEFKFGVTVSIGYSHIDDNQSLAMNLKCVDYALQQAKLAGKNQIQQCDFEHFNPQDFQIKYFKKADLNLFN